MNYTFAPIVFATTMTLGFTLVALFDGEPRPAYFLSLFTAFVLAVLFGRGL